MSKVSVKSVNAEAIAETATITLVQTLWNQWSLLNPSAASRTVADHLVDPEALVLTSAALVQVERRFGDMLAWFAEIGSGLLSVQRSRTIVELVPGDPSNASEFASWALQFSGDRRWLSFEPKASPYKPRRGKGPEGLNLESPATLMLRLRAAFGVGVKADLLAFLICLNGEGRSATEIAQAVQYTDKTIRVAVRDLCLSGFVHEDGNYPAQYYVSPGFAPRLLELMYERKLSLPDWKYFPQVFALLLTVSRWTQDDFLMRDQYIASSAARDLFHKHESVFRFLRIRMPRPEAFVGAEYLPAFAEFIERVKLWLEGSHESK